ncbi:MAG: recombinase family protein [Desulfotomaculales bacterium]
MPVPVAALYRVSTMKQNRKQGRSVGRDDDIPVQASLIREFVAQHPEWVLVREYVEKGVSAFKFSKDERDVVQQAIADAINGVFKILLVFKSDRLSRKSLEYPLILWQFHRVGVTVISVAEGGKVLEMKDQYDKLVRFIEGWQGETESVNTSIRVSEHMRKLAREGRWSGGRPPYGFRLSASRRGLPLEIDEGEAAVIREMVRMYLEEGLGSKRIANRLNERGYRTREGRLWTDTRVRQVLQNPIIAGLPAYDRTRKGSTPNSRVRIQGYTDLSRFIVPRDENGNPKPVSEWAIISLGTWLELVERMRRNATGQPAPRSMASSALLTGFLVCGYCGRTFISSGHNRVWRNGEPRPCRKRVYRCVTHARVGGGSKLCAGQGSYSQKKVDAVFLRELETFTSALDPDELARYIEQKQMDSLAEVANRTRALDAELRRARKVLVAWVKRLDDYFAAPENSLYTEELLASRVKEYQETVARLETELEALKAVARAERRRRVNLLDFSRRAREWFRLFLEAPVETRKRMLAQIVEKVVLYRDKIEIHYSVDLAEFLGREAGEETDLRLTVSASL